MRLAISGDDGPGDVRSLEVRFRHPGERWEPIEAGIIRDGSPNPAASWIPTLARMAVTHERRPEERFRRLTSPALTP